MFKTFTFTCLLFVGLCALQPSLVVASATTSVATGTTTVATTTATTTSTTTPIETRVMVEKRVREYFVDIPVMIKIAQCESNFRQFTDGGSVFRGGFGGGMVGVFQFYESLHASAARALGFNLSTLEGNLGYARHLYTVSGSTPWSACVPQSPIVIASDPNLELRITLLTKVFELLQQLLALKLAGK